MLLPLVRAELFKLSRRAMPRVLLIILVLAALGLYLLLWFAVRSNEQSTDPRSLEILRQGLRVEAVRDTGLDIVRTVGTILVVIQGVSTISTEYSWGTIRTLLPRAGSRFNFLTAKLLLMLLFVAVVVLLGYLAALAGSVVVSTAEDLDTSLGGNFLPLTLAALARTAFTMLPYLSLGFGIAVLTRSTAAGIAVTLSVLFLEGLGVQVLRAIGGPLERLSELLISENVSAVMRPNFVAGDLPEPETDLPNAWRAAGVLAVYTAIFVGLAYRRFLTRDITSG